ncbi:MAG: ABC transporter ATP-binding protein [Phycisphaerales bacterium]|nr:ABC transporter ATP-binding protein [Phycisphaerales bacterium]
MLEAKGLTRRFGALLAVDDVSFTAQRGRVTGMLGPNGAGKTTTLRMLCGVLLPDQGTVLLDGKDLHRSPPAVRRGLGWLPDAAPAWDELRVEQWLTLRTRLYGVDPSAIESALDRCDLMSVRSRIIGRLSRGFRQRVALAAAIVHDPAVLVLDEPGTGLDPLQQRAFRALIRELAQDRAVLLSTHQVGDAQAICDDLVVLSGGRVCAQGDLETLRQSVAGGRLLLETEGDPTEALQGLDGIERVQVEPLEDGWHRATIVPHAHADDLRSAIAAAVTAAGLKWRQLERAVPTLDALIDAPQSKVAP